VGVQTVPADALRQAGQVIRRGDGLAPQVRVLALLPLGLGQVEEFPGNDRVKPVFVVGHDPVLPVVVMNAPPVPILDLGDPAVLDPVVLAETADVPDVRPGVDRVHQDRTYRADAPFLASRRWNAVGIQFLHDGAGALFLVDVGLEDAANDGHAVRRALDQR